MLLFLYIISGRRLSEDHGDYDGDDGEQQLVETEQEMMEEEYDENGKSYSWEKQGVLLEPDLERTRETERGEFRSSMHANAFVSELSEAEKTHSIDHCVSNMEKFRKEIQQLKQQYRDQVTTKCLQLKIHRKKDDDFKEVIQDFDNRETQPVLDRMKLVEDRWRKMDLWGILKLVNPSPIMKFDREKLLLRDETPAETEVDITLRWSILLCCIFEDLMRKFGWKVGDTLDIEEDICEVVEKLILNVTGPDSSSLLNGLLNTVIHLQADAGKRDCDKLRKLLLITKKKYNGLNLACILLEQMILDNKDNNVA